MKEFTREIYDVVTGPGYSLHNIDMPIKYFWFVDKPVIEYYNYYFYPDWAETHT